MQMLGLPLKALVMDTNTRSTQCETARTNSCTHFAIGPSKLVQISRMGRGIKPCKYGNAQYNTIPFHWVVSIRPDAILLHTFACPSHPHCNINTAGKNPEAGPGKPLQVPGCPRRFSGRLRKAPEGSGWPQRLRRAPAGRHRMAP